MPRHTVHDSKLVLSCIDLDGYSTDFNSDDDDEYDYNESNDDDEDGNDNADKSMNIFTESDPKYGIRTKPIGIENGYDYVGNLQFSQERFF